MAPEYQQIIYYFDFWLLLLLCLLLTRNIDGHVEKTLKKTEGRKWSAVANDFITTHKTVGLFLVKVKILNMVKG